MKTQVLVVDDDEVILHTVAVVLSGAGFSILKASNGLECLEHLRLGFRGVILMDVMMPEMDGWTTIRKMVKEGLENGNLICMLTGIDEPGRQAEELQEHVFNYLSKPFEGDVLIAMVQDAIECLNS